MFNELFFLIVAIFTFTEVSNSCGITPFFYLKHFSVCLETSLKILKSEIRDLKDLTDVSKQISGDCLMLNKCT